MFKINISTVMVKVVLLHLPLVQCPLLVTKFYISHLIIFPLLAELCTPADSAHPGRWCLVWQMRDGGFPNESNVKLKKEKHTNSSICELKQ